MSNPSTQNDAVRRSFGKQVPLFTGPTSVFAGTAGAPDQWGPLAGDWIVLEVACGASHVAEQLAPHVRQVVAVDLTATLLDLGAQRLREAGIANVLLQQGDAAALPFLDDSFDVVVCRSSLHHFADVQRSVREMGRVCRDGGRVVIDELIQPPGADAGTRKRFDDLHRLLDPSHLHALTDDEIVELVGEAVGSIEQHDLREPAVLPIAAILTDASDRAGVLRTIEAELAGGPASGFEPLRVDEAIHVAFHTAQVHAIKRRR